MPVVIMRFSSPASQQELSLSALLCSHLCRDAYLASATPLLKGAGTLVLPSGELL